jgi:2-keto-4-pentenoate hydratase/2-oxohepta-3-ene-1,7-dioic acid hydratase in catechol pathway
MKLVTFRHPKHSNELRVGAVSGDRLIDLHGAVGGRDMNRVIDDFAALAPELAAAIRDARETFALADVKLAAPIPLPRRNIFCVGKNYHEHAHEFAGSGFDSSAAQGAVPAHPIVFSKPPSAVSAPGDAIDTSLDLANSVDYEAELAIVIGKAGRCGEHDDPLSFVFGYTLINDVTSRGLQKQHSQWLLGKGIDGFCPMGPTLVTADEIGDVRKLTISCEVNGERRQHASVADLIFDVPTLIRTIGRSISFVPGDVIATGTPAGVGIGFTPPKYLKKGDTVRVMLEPIGVLDNPVA